MKRFVHEKSPVDMIRDYDRSRKDVESKENIECYSDASHDDSQFELVERKQVMDWDGFYTDYTLYYDVLNDRFVTVFGDRDLYRPEDGDYDAEFDSEWEAREWFDSYRGAEEDDDEQ